MSETTLTDQPNAGMLLDGDAPRLASTPMTAPAPGERKPQLDAPVIELPADAPTLPVVSPVLASAEVTTRPDTPATAPTTEEADAPVEDSESDHPMAHLMPSKSAPSEASKRAAEIRAAKKAKAKKIKIGVAAGFLVFAVAAGPPLFGWLTDAINEAGNTSTVQE